MFRKKSVILLIFIIILLSSISVYAFTLPPGGLTLPPAPSPSPSPTPTPSCISGTRCQFGDVYNYNSCTGFGSKLTDCTAGYTGAEFCSADLTKRMRKYSDGTCKTFTSTFAACTPAYDTVLEDCSQTALNCVQGTNCACDANYQNICDVGGYKVSQCISTVPVQCVSLSCVRSRQSTGDNDGDAADNECDFESSSPTLGYPGNVPLDCQDNIDNDADGAIDSYDAGCSTCPSTCDQCGQGITNACDEKECSTCGYKVGGVACRFEPAIGGLWGDCVSDVCDGTTCEISSLCNNQGSCESAGCSWDSTYSECCDAGQEWDDASGSCVDSTCNSLNCGSSICQNSVDCLAGGCVWSPPYGPDGHCCPQDTEWSESFQSCEEQKASVCTTLFPEQGSIDKEDDKGCCQVSLAYGFWYPIGLLT